MRPSSSDQALATEAADLLAMWGRPDLKVTDEQVLRWRQAHLLPVLSDRLGGRGRPTAYGPNAAQVAAALALELASFRNLDEAALSAFVTYSDSGGCRGGPVAEKGLRRAYGRYIATLENLCKQAKGALEEASGKGAQDSRSAIPRRLRVPFAGSRRPGSHKVAEAILGASLGEPKNGDIELALGALIGDDGLAILNDEPEGLPDGEVIPSAAALIGQMSLRFLRLALGMASYDDLLWGCRVASTVVGFTREFPAFLEVTRADVHMVEASLPAFGARLIRLARKLPPRFTRPGPTVAVLGIFAAIATRTSQSWRRELTKAVQELETLRPKLVVLTQLALALPDKWRPALAPVTGVAYVAGLEPTDREELLDEIRAQDTMGVLARLTLSV